MLPFIILDVDSPHNAFLSRLALAEFWATLIPWCLTSKFPTDNDVGVLYSDQATGCACYIAELREAQRKEKGKGIDKSFTSKQSKIDNQHLGLGSGTIVGSITI